MSPLVRIFASELFSERGGGSGGGARAGGRQAGGVAGLPGGREHAQSARCVPLTRPSFSPFNPGLVAVGSETHRGFPDSSNAVLLAQARTLPLVRPPPCPRSPEGAVLL